MSTASQTQKTGAFTRLMTVKKRIAPLAEIVEIMFIYRGGKGDTIYKLNPLMGFVSF